MSNLNLDLIEKVRNRTAAIHNAQNKGNKHRLRELLAVIFPKDEPSICLANMEYYYSNTDLVHWNSSDTLPGTMEAIPFQSFFTNQLTPEDNKTIELIDERLKQLNIDENSSVMLEFLCRPDISQKIVKMLDGEKQPSPAKDEVRYVRCIQSIFGFQDKHIYELKQILTNDTESGVIYDGKQWSSYAQYRMFFMPASEEEYQAQQQVEDVKDNLNLFYELIEYTTLPREGKFYINFEVSSENGLTEAEAEIVAQKIKNLFKNSKGQVDYEATLNFQDSVGEQIKEAIESYHTLKQQNEEMIAMLKECQVGIEEDIAKIDFNSEAYIDLKIKLQKITETITKHKI